MKNILGYFQNGVLPENVAQFFEKQKTYKKSILAGFWDKIWKFDLKDAKMARDKQIMTKSLKSSPIIKIKYRPK